jgi:hypothetical protein
LGYGPLSSLKRTDIQAKLKYLKQDNPLFYGTPETLDDITSISYMRSGAGEDEILFTDVRPGSKADPELIKQGIEKLERQQKLLNIHNQMRQTAEIVVDPSRHEGLLGQGLLDATRSVPYTAMAMVPYVGMVVNSAAMADQGFYQLKEQGLSDEHAHTASLIAAPFQGLSEKINAKILLGKAPIISNMFNKWVWNTTAPGRVVRGLERLASGTVAEMTTENFQDVAPLLSAEIVEEFVDAAEQDFPDFEWGAIINEQIKRQPELFAAVVPLVLLGVGAGSVRDNLQLQQSLTQPELLRGFGINLDDALDISELAKGKKFTEAEAKLRESMANIGMDGRSLDEVATDGAIGAREAMKKMLESREQLDVLQTAGLLPSIVQTEQGWGLVQEVKQQDGTFVEMQPATQFFKTFEEAKGRQQKILTERQVDLSEDTRTLLSHIEKNQGRGVRTRFMFSPESRTTQQEREEGGDKEQLRKREEQADREQAEGSQQDVSEIDDLGEKTEQEFKEAEAAAMAASQDEGDKEMIHLILGRSSHEFADGIFVRNVELFRGATLATVLEETSEADAGRIMGEMGMDFLLDKLRRFEEISGIVLFPEEGEIVESDVKEAYSTIVRSYFLTRSEDLGEVGQTYRQLFSNMIDSGLGGAMAAYRDIFRAMQRRAETIGKVREKEGIDPELEAMLEKSLGMQEGRQFTREVENEAVRMAEDLTRGRQAPATFSTIAISPEMDADYMAAVEAGDMATAQRMVDEAAKAAGYKVRAWHGSPRALEGLKFDRSRIGETSGINRDGFSFTTNEEKAGSYARGLGEEEAELAWWVHEVNTIIRSIPETTEAEIWDMPAYESLWDSGAMDADRESLDDIPRALREMADMIREQEPDAAKKLDKLSTSTPSKTENPSLYGVYLKLNSPRRFETTLETMAEDVWGVRAIPESDVEIEVDDDLIYFVYSPENIKSADPVTYDADGNVVPLSKRFDATRDEITYSVLSTSKMDTDYLAAVEAGDMETVRKMVDEAARAAGYEQAFHGTASTYVEGDVFRLPLFVTQDEKVADSYSEGRTAGKKYSGRTLGLYVKGPFADEQTVQEIAREKGFWKEGDTGYMFLDPAQGIESEVAEVIEELRNRGFTGTRLDDFGLDDPFTVVESIAIIEQGAIKDGASVTEDADGNVIPLSQRFDQGRDEITYSVLSPAKMLEAEVKGMSSDEVRDYLKNVKLTPTKEMVAMLGSYPEYLDPVIDYILEKREDLLNGETSPRDVAKAYWITIASIGADAIDVSTIKAHAEKHGIEFDPDPLYMAVGKKGQDQMRPEELAAYWLGTEDGQKALDNIEKGIFRKPDWESGLILRDAFGRNDLRSKKKPTEKNPEGTYKPGAVGIPKKNAFNLRNLQDAVETIRDAKGNPEKLETALKRIVGIGEGKKGFIGHLLGFGEWATLDAVELNMWLTGEGETTYASKANKKRAAVAKRASGSKTESEDLFRRIRKRINNLRKTADGGSKIPEEVAAHVIHHWIWDAGKGLETTHEGVYHSMRTHSVIRSTEYLRQDDRFEELVKEGRVKTERTIDDFAGQHILLHAPDNAFSGKITFEDGQELEGKGGVLYPSLYADLNYFWASTKAVAERTANHLNEIGRKNGGKVLMALVSAPVAKLFSSTTMSRGVVRFFEALADQPRKSGITKAKFNSMLVKASRVTIKDDKGKEKKFEVNPLDARNGLAANLERVDGLLDPDNAVFAVRKAFVESLLKQLAEEIGTDKAKADPKVLDQAKFVADKLHGEHNPYAKSTLEKGWLSLSNLRQGLGNLLTEPFLRDFQEGNQNGMIYAVIEVEGEVEAIESTHHESYPFAIVPKNKKSKVVLHALKESHDWQEVVGHEESGFGDVTLIDPKTKKPYTKPFDKARLNLFPTSGMSSTTLKVMPKTDTRAKGKELSFSALRMPKDYAEAQARVDQMLSPFQRSPKLRGEIVRNIRERAQEQLEKWVDIVEQQGLIEESRKEEIRLRAKKTVEDFVEEEEKAGRTVTDEERKKMLSEARKEAQIYYRQEAKDVTTLDREQLRAALRTIEAITMQAPPEVRGKLLRGSNKIASLKTPAAMLKEIERRVAKLDQELEYFLWKEAEETRKNLFRKIKRGDDRTAGKKRKATLTAEFYELFEAADQAMAWDRAKGEIEAEKLQLEAEAMESEDVSKMTPDQLEEHHNKIAKLELTAEMYRGFAGWMELDSILRFHAVDTLEELRVGAWEMRKQNEAKRREFLEEKRSEAWLDAKASGNVADLQNALNEAKKHRKGAQGLLSWDQLFDYWFGSESETYTYWTDRLRHAENLRHDLDQETGNLVQGLMQQIGGSKRNGMKVDWDLNQDIIETKEGNFTPMQAVDILLTWRQEDGRRHMMGPLDEEGNPRKGGREYWHYDQKFVDDLKRQLTDKAPAAIKVYKFLRKQYRKEWERINPLYRQIYGVNLPKNIFYAPLKVQGVSETNRDQMDPTTGLTKSGTVTPNSLRSRGHAIARPTWVNALQKFSGHKRQINHFLAFAEFNRDAQSILGERSIQNGLTEKFGVESVNNLNFFLRFYRENGNTMAGAELGFNTDWLGKATSNFAQMAIVGRIGTIALQSSQLTAARAEMSAADYYSRVVKLFAGDLEMGWKEAWNSDYIQRRLEEMPPIVRQALQHNNVYDVPAWLDSAGLGDMARGVRRGTGNDLKYAVGNLGRTIAGADALFTAGTFAIIYDQRLSAAKAKGMPNPEKHALNEAERITDKVAQPTRPGSRSSVELSFSANPLGALVFNFGSEARKNIGLMLVAAVTKDATRLGRSVAYAVILQGIMSAVIRNVWREARDSDDESYFDAQNNWARRFMLDAMTEWLYGVPIFGEEIQSMIYSLAGEYKYDSTPLSSIGRGATRIPRLLTGESIEDGTALRDLEGLIEGMGIFSDSAAASASFMHLFRDLSRLGENILTD